MSGGIGRRFLNLGLFDGRKRAYSLRRLDLSKMDFFHPTAQEAATHRKVVPTLTPAKACAPNRRRICSTDLATTEAATPKINPPKSELLVRPPEVSYSIRSPRCLHFLPTALDSKVILDDHANRMLRFDTIDGCSCIDTMPSLHGYKHSPLAISVPPTDLHLLHGEDTGDLYIIDSVLHPDKAEVLALRHPPGAPVDHPPQELVYGHALVGDTICFSISGSEGDGTYCFHMATREWSKAGDWLMPFDGKADYAPELGLWFGVSKNLTCVADLSGSLSWTSWMPWIDKDCNEMGKQFALFTGMEAAYGNKGKSDDGKNNSNNNNNGSKGKGLVRGLRMIKHKSGRCMFNNQQRIEEVL
uniref:Uncharacterized protein n=1 Tax=Aegilops tauschii TaxID=37682 RepID=M8C1I1_AEGTA